jgi:rhamnosyltransferase
MKALHTPDMARLATVIIRTKDSEDTIAQALAGLRAQSFRAFETLVVDSGSTDETLSIVDRHPCRLIRIRPEEYYPGPVLNRAIAAAPTPIVVFQNSDVVPLGPRALERLLEPIIDGEADATFARQLPRPEAHTWVRDDYGRAFPPTGPTPDWLPYSLPFAAMLRSRWAEFPFYDRAWGSEDTEWGCRAREAGVRVRYVPEATVMHSHNYTLRQIYGRKFIEGEADAFIYGGHTSVTRATVGLISACVRDAIAHGRRRDVRGLLASPARRSVYHWAYFRGRRHGERRIRLHDPDASMGQKVVLDRYEG